jgi:Secretion system C-terminal sorting domain
MKTGIHCRSFLTVFFLLIFQSIIIGQVPNIIAVETINEDTSYVGIYNYETLDYEILFKLTPRVRPSNYSITFDPFRKIIYYMTAYGGCTGSSEWVLYSIDLINKNRITKYSFDWEIPILDFQYDFFSNNLMLRGDDTLRFLDVDSAIIRSIVTLPISERSLHQPQNESYNLIDRSYLYYTNLISKNEQSLIYVNIDSNKYTTVSNTYNDWPLTPAVNPTTSQYYGVSRKKNDNDSAYIVSINPKTGCFTEHCLLPAEYVGSTSFGLFDSYNSKYITSYYTSVLGNYKFAIYDLNSGIIDTSHCRFSQSYLFMDYDPRPILKQINKILVASKSNNYEWYCNEVRISNTNNRTHIPQSTGTYKFSTTNYKGDTVYSNEIYIEVANSIVAMTEMEEISIYPNPTFDYLNLNLKHKHFYLSNVSILDLNGNIITNKVFRKDEPIRFDVSEYPDGVYFIIFENNNKSMTRIFIKKSL